MHRKHQKTLELVFARPVSGGVKWRDIEALLVALGADVTEREGSRVGVKLFDDRRVFTARTRHQIRTRRRLKIYVNG